MSEIEILQQLSLISSILNRYIVLVIFVVGFIGNILNVLIFSRKNLRQNTCVLYFFFASLFNLLTLLFGAFPRTLISFGIDPSMNSTFCKFRFYFTYLGQSVSIWLLVFAGIDRYLSSSMNIARRRWMNTKKTYQIILLICISTTVSYTQVFYCFEVSTLTKNLCNFRDRTCDIVDIVFIFVYNTFLPSTLMLIFGVAMFINIRRSRRRVGNIFQFSPSPNIVDRKNRHLISVILLQVVLVLISMIPVAMMKLYLFVTRNLAKSFYRSSLEGFIYQLVVIIYYLYSIGLFFIHTLCGSIFRRELIRLCSISFFKNSIRQRTRIDLSGRS